MGKYAITTLKFKPLTIRRQEKKLQVTAQDFLQIQIETLTEFELNYLI